MPPETNVLTLVERELARLHMVQAREAQDRIPQASLRGTVWSLGNFFRHFASVKSR
jgi:hypothetical protein